MKSITFLLFSAIFCFSLTSAYVPLRGYDRITSQEEIARINYLIKSGATAALDLAAADEVIGDDDADRYHIDRVKYVSKQYRDADEVTSYFAEVRLVNPEDENVRADLGFVVDKSDRNGKLNLRAYKIQFD